MSVFALGLSGRALAALQMQVQNDFRASQSVSQSARLVSVPVRPLVNAHSFL